jgi:hypothetical protein
MRKPILFSFVVSTLLPRESEHIGLHITHPFDSGNVAPSHASSAYLDTYNMETVV